MFEPFLHMVHVGGLRWNSYVVRCPECGSDGPWLLKVEQEPWVVGQLAWLECHGGHVVFHPLVYPQVAQRLCDWAQTPVDDRSPLDEVLADWRPHYLETSTSVFLTSEDPSAILRYWPWTSAPTQPGYWSRNWPGLVEAASAPG